MSTQFPRKYHDKEIFVTGHKGTSSFEISLLCLVVPVGLHLYCKFHPLLHERCLRNPFGAEIALEFVTFVVPMLLVQTSMLPYIWGPLMLILVMLLLAHALPYRNAPSIALHRICEENRRPTFLSIYRSSVYLMTSIAILAVDFQIFPRRYCKTEISGYGWMDLGAASFVILSGWTSALTTSATIAEPCDNAHPKIIGPSPSMIFYKTLKKCMPLALLGFLRLATNKGLEYQEHVSEYGVHWNFFFTLLFVEGFMVAWRKFRSIIGRISSSCGINGGSFLSWDGIMGLMMLAFHQTYLSCFGGQEFIENAGRKCIYDEELFNNPSWSLCDVFLANREGILGITAYSCLRLLSEDIGRFCLWPKQQLLSPPPPSSESTAATIAMEQYLQHDSLSSKRQKRLFLMSLLLYFIHSFLSTMLHIPTSRRSTNAPFLLWALSHNTFILCLIHYVIFIDSSIHKCNDALPCITSSDAQQPTPVLLLAVNRFGLPVFLLSNIFTGLINLSMDTLHSSNGKAMMVLFVYLACVCGSALLMDHLLPQKQQQLHNKKVV